MDKVLKQILRIQVKIDIIPRVFIVKFPREIEKSSLETINSTVWELP